MLPRATHERTRREVASGKPSGRTQEIQRLIGRSLRAVVNLQAIGERQIVLDCDVIQADGGTRTASITGAWVALHEALKWMRGARHARIEPLTEQVPPISCGIVKGTPVLDLDYAEDSTAETDANFVITGTGGIVEVQGTAEGKPFSEDEFSAFSGSPRTASQSRPAKENVALGKRRPGGLRSVRDHRLLVGKVVIATHNAGKLREMRELMAPFGVEAVSAGELGLPEPAETGHMFSENAAIKAVASAPARGLPAISDDFGSLRGRARRRSGPVHGRLGGA